MQIREQAGAAPNLNGMMATRILNQAQIDLKAHVLAGTVAMLWGKPGIGKSAMARAVADDLTAETGNHWGFIDTRPSLRLPSDFLGIPAPDMESRKAVWLQPDIFPRADRDGEYGIWMLDEISACSLAVQVALYQLIYDGALGEYKKPPGWIIVGAGNNLEDKAAAVRMSSALDNRVAHIDVEPDHIAWCDWAILNGIHPHLISYIRNFKPEHIWFKPAGARAYSTPRSLEVASRYAGMKDKAARLRLMSQVIGDGVAGEFCSYSDLIQDLVPISVILANPDQAPIPDFGQLSTLYAITYALAANVDELTARAGAIYCRRLPADFQALYASVISMRMESTKNPRLARGLGDIVASGIANL